MGGFATWERWAIRCALTPPGRDPAYGRDAGGLAAVKPGVAQVVDRVVRGGDGGRFVGADGREVDRAVRHGFVQGFERVVVETVAGHAGEERPPALAEFFLLASPPLVGQAGEAGGHQPDADGHRRGVPRRVGVVGVAPVAAPAAVAIHGECETTTLVPATKHVPPANFENLANSPRATPKGGRRRSSADRP